MYIFLDRFNTVKLLKQLAQHERIFLASLFHLRDAGTWEFLNFWNSLEFFWKMVTWIGRSFNDGQLVL